MRENKGSAPGNKMAVMKDINFCNIDFIVDSLVDFILLTQFSLVPAYLVLVECSVMITFILLSQTTSLKILTTTSM